MSQKLRLLLLLLLLLMLLLLLLMLLLLYGKNTVTGAALDCANTSATRSLPDKMEADPSPLCPARPAATGLSVQSLRVSRRLAHTRRLALTPLATRGPGGLT